MAGTGRWMRTAIGRPTGGQYPNLIYWGKYVAHDNNRDALGMALALSRNLLGTFLHWKPQVMHDLHESVAYLYTSTGLGPYNEHVDPITINEWHNLAYEEVTELTRARDAGSLDTRLLQWLGSQLHVVDGQRPQFHWSFL